MCLRVLKESNKSRFDSYSCQKHCIDHIPYYLSGQPAVQAFSSGAQFARESAMLKLPEERRKWASQRERGGGGRKKGKHLLENTVKMRNTS